MTSLRDEETTRCKDVLFLALWTLPHVDIARGTCTKYPYFYSATVGNDRCTFDIVQKTFLRDVFLAYIHVMYFVEESTFNHIVASSKVEFMGHGTSGVKNVPPTCLSIFSKQATEIWKRGTNW